MLSKILACVGVLTILAAVLIVGCASEYDGPTGGPRCGAAFSVGEAPGLNPLATPPEMRDAIWFGITIPFPCEGGGLCEGEAFTTYFFTIDVGGGDRVYFARVDDGPGKDTWATFETLNDAEATMKVFLEANGYDANCSETEEFLEELFDWLDGHWMTAEDFYSTYGI